MTPVNPKMLPLKLLSVLTVSFVSISSVVEGSEVNKTPVGSRRKSPRNSEASIQGAPRLHVPTDAELVALVNETSQHRCRRESAFVPLPVANPTDYTCGVKWDNLTHRIATFPSPAYMQLATDPNHAEARYYPLVIDERDVEDQRNPTGNFMSRIMAQYRRDMGFREMDTGDIKVEEPEVIAFLLCFKDTPISVYDQNLELSRLIAEYDFLKSAGLIPANTNEGCEAIKKATGFNSFSDFKTSYEQNISAYTFIDWNLVDLTRFRGLKFPILDKMIKEFKLRYFNKVYTTPYVLSTFGQDAFRKYSDQIRFFNPRTLEGRQMLLFQRIYRRYSQADAKFNSDFIDWNKWNVSNWPLGMNQSDLLSWTDNQISLMNLLIDQDQINFVSRNLSAKNVPLPLIIPARFNSVVKIAYNHKDINGYDSTTLSDDEAICGPRASKNDNYKAANKKLKNLKDKIDARKAAKNTGKEAKEERKKKKHNKEESTEQAPRTIKRARNSTPSDEEAEFDENDYSVEYGTDIRRRRTSTEIMSKTAKGKGKRNIKDTSSEPADPAERDAVLKRALALYRKQTSSSEALAIKWKFAMVMNLQNHLLPFSTGFETSGDVRTLRNMMDQGHLRFLNRKSLRDCQIRAYEKLYQIYAEACGIFRHEYLIYFGDVEFEGIPSDLEADCEYWTEAQISEIAKNIKSNTVVARKTDEFEAETQAILAKAEATSGNKESSEDSRLSSIDGSDTSSNSSFVMVEHPATKMTSKFVSIPTAVPKKKSNKTPNFADLAMAHNNPWNGINELGDDEEFDEPLPRIVKTGGAVAGSGAFAGSSVADINTFIADIQSNIVQTITARFSHDQSSRHYRIFTEILRALNSLHQHAKHSLNPETTAEPLIDTAEINGYLEVFHSALRRIDNYGNIPDQELQTFIINRTMLRARLAGIEFNSDKLGVTKLKLKTDQILGGYGLCSFLTKAVNHWDTGILEIMLDNEDEPFFAAPMKAPRKK